MKQLLIVLTVTLVSVPAFAQRDWSKIEVTATHVAGNVYMLLGAGGNIGVLAGPDGLLIVDDQFEPLAEKIRAALKEINPGRLKFVLNTHWHGDHTGGNVLFGAEAPIIAHTNVRKRLSEDQKRGEQVIPASAKAGLPVITYDDGISVHFNGEEIRVVHYPKGHTDGDSVIFFTGSKVIHIGDLMFNGTFPFVDLDSGGDVAGLLKDVDAVIARAPADVRIIPGHGAVATLDDLRSYASMLRETTEVVRKQMKSGRSLAEIQKKGLGETWKGWGGGFIKEDRWIATIHQSLSAPAKK